MLDTVIGRSSAVPDTPSDAGASPASAPRGVRAGGCPRLKTRWMPCANVLRVGKSKAPAHKQAPLAQLVRAADS